MRVGNALTESLFDSSQQQVAGVNTADPDAYDLYLQARKASATFSFAVGVAFAAFVMLPFSIKYLQGFMSDIV